MGDLNGRIEKLEDQVAPRVQTMLDLFSPRMDAAIGNEGTSPGCSYHALLGVWTAYLSGPDLVTKALSLLDGSHLTERLLGAEITLRLRAGEDGRDYSCVENPEHGRSLRRLAIAGIAGDLGDWIIATLKADLDLDGKTRERRLLNVLRQLAKIDAAHDSLEIWTGPCPGA